MANVIKEYHYPQAYFLEPEALIHFGIKGRTYKRWLADGVTIPGRYKVKGTNYYVIEPHEFHTWLIETRIEKATQFNKLHNGRKRNHVKGGKPTSDAVPADHEANHSASLSTGAKQTNGLAT